MARSLLQFAPTPHAFPVLRQARARTARTAKPWRLGPLGFSYAAALADAVAIIAAALATTLLRMLAFGGPLRGLQTGFDIGLIVAVLVVLAELHNGGYAPTKYADRSGQFARAFPLWNLTALAALALGVAARVIGDYPRGGLALFYLLGLASLVLTRRAVAGALSTLHARGLASRRRVAVVGFEHDIDALQAPGDADGDEFVCRFALRETESFFLEDLALAVAAIRLHRPDEVFVALPLSRGDLVDACLAALLKLPIARRPEDWRAVPPYLAMSYLYKRSNRLWHTLIRHRLTGPVWRPLVEWTRRRHLRFRVRLEARTAPGEGVRAVAVVSAGV